MDGYIYNYATPSNPAIDVTGYECPTASPTADANGSFHVDPIWPNSAIGDHTILAQQGSEQATALVDYSPAQ
jgi:hypothetical protein